MPHPIPHRIPLALLLATCAAPATASGLPFEIAPIANV